MQRAVLVMNNKAGTLQRQPDLRGRIEEILRRDFDLQVIGDEDGAEMGTRLDRAVASDAPVIIVGGGDGTVHGAARRIAGTDRILAVVPLGTLNLLARDLGMPLDPAEAAAALRTAQTQNIDLGEVNGVVFTCQAVLGLPNRFARFRQANRRKSGFVARLKPILGTLRGMARPPMRLQISMPGSPMREVRAAALSVVNNPYEEAVGSLFRRPQLDLGYLAVYRPRRFGVLWGVFMILAMVFGSWRRADEVEHFRTETLTVNARRPHMRVAVDGELQVLDLPLRFSVRPGALRVLRPENPA
ncbi:diacylglycerol/lipid kinase family protein [Roseomonas elaeocarpi]|uniref:Diacylglycerol/lipid kinase family protein n=1 Tax=Roseomonas elaeocarpi TaxID=907779 RepID=A0ABV6JXD1_9PROT